MGFGDIVPKSDLGKVLAMVNSLIGVLSFSFFVAILAVALQPSGYAGSGDIQANPHHSTPNPDGFRQNDAESGPFTQEAFRFFSSLFDLLDSKDRHSEARVHLQFAPTGGEGSEKTLAVDIFVYRWEGAKL